MGWEQQAREDLKDLKKRVSDLELAATAAKKEAPKKEAPKKGGK